MNKVTVKVLLALSLSFSVYAYDQNQSQEQQLYWEQQQQIPKPEAPESYKTEVIETTKFNGGKIIIDRHHFNTVKTTETVTTEDQVRTNWQEGERTNEDHPLEKTPPCDQQNEYEWIGDNCEQNDQCGDAQQSQQDKISMTSDTMETKPSVQSFTINRYNEFIYNNDNYLTVKKTTVKEYYNTKDWDSHDEDLLEPEDECQQVPSKRHVKKRKHQN